MRNNLKAITRSILFLSLIFSFSAIACAQETNEVAVTGIEWQNKEGLLNYNLSKESPVKIRVGVLNGPVYRTIVNLQARLKGGNIEHWDGKDEESKIDFLKYAEAHFCVESPLKLFPDSVLNVTFLEGAVLKGGVMQISEINEISVDAQNNIKPLYLKEKAELRVYIDNKLWYIDKVNALPVTFSLTTSNIPEGPHLLTINLWPALNFSCVAYKSFEVMFPTKPEPAQDVSGVLTGKIAFSALGKDGFWQIFTSTFDGKNIKQLTETAQDKRYPSWSADGKTLAYVNNIGELWIMNENGLNNRKINLPIRCSEPVFSPGGKNILFTGLEDVYHGSTKIWEVDLDTLKLKKLVVRPWLQYNPGYSPDGAALIFTDGPELFGQNIYKFDFKSADVTQLTDNGAYDYDMQAVFLNTGQEIVYSTNEDNNNYEIYRMDKFGRDKVNLTKSPASSDIMPKVSKKSDTVFFLSDRSGWFSIWRMNSDGSNVKQVMPDNQEINSFSIYAQ